MWESSVADAKKTYWLFIALAGEWLSQIQMGSHLLVGPFVILLDLQSVQQNESAVG